MMRLSDFDFELPEELIAQQPAPMRAASRLLVVHPDRSPDGALLEDRHFEALPALLEPGDLLVFNDTKVIRARLLGVKDTGGRVEALVERITGTCDAIAMLRASKPPRLGSRLVFGTAGAEVLGRSGEFWALRFDAPVTDVLDREGHVPLPPYITHAPAPEDERRYQTVYARAAGSVAAPTAGLHFDDALLERLQARGIGLAWLTLHVGAGTFQPVRVEDLSRHEMHAERYVVPEATAEAIERTRRDGGRIVGVGTTSLRTLESVAAAHDGQIVPGSGETQLFVTPGYRFRAVDLLITNFHLPKSTLLMLVSAFAGIEAIRQAYRHAISERYRFFSYGDAMLLERAPDRPAQRPADRRTAP